MKKLIEYILPIFIGIRSLNVVLLFCIVAGRVGMGGLQPSWGEEGKSGLQQLISHALREQVVRKRCSLEFGTQ